MTDDCSMPIDDMCGLVVIHTLRIAVITVVVVCRVNFPRLAAINFEKKKK